MLAANLRGLSGSEGQLQQAAIGRIRPILMEAAGSALAKCPASVFDDHSPQDLVQAGFQRIFGIVRGPTPGWVVLP